MVSKHAFKLTQSVQPLLDRWKQLVNTKTNDKCLREAALTGHMDLIKLFIKRGATKWDWGLHSAAIRGDRALVDFFISKGAHNWDEAIEAAAQGNHKDLIHFFQSQIEGPDIEFNTLRSILYGASIGGHKHLIDDCLNRLDHDVHVLNHGLQGAAEGGKMEVIEFFIEKGADFWIGAFGAACKGGHMEIVNFFLTKIDEWHVHRRGLFMAARGGQKHVIDFLISIGATDLHLGIDGADKEGHNGNETGRIAKIAESSNPLPRFISVFSSTYARKRDTLHESTINKKLRKWFIYCYPHKSRKSWLAAGTR